MRLIMFSAQHIISNNVDNNDYDFENSDNATKWKGTFLSALRKVLEQVHPSLSVGDDALFYLESLCLRLLGMLCAKPPPHTIQDIEERIGKTFPTPIDKWALNEARETIDKSKKKKTVLPADRIHSMLQKEVLQYKIDSSVALYLAAVLEYISADILKLAGNYVKNFKHVEISKQDIKVAMNADKALMDMFQSDADSITPKPIAQTPLTNLSYEDLVKEFIHDEKQYQRDLHMIIRVFREELAKIVNDPKELDEIFSNINDIYEVTVTLLGSLEDVIEMSEERPPVCVGSCFEEFAEAAEFDVYIKYASDIVSSHSRDALQNLLMKQDATKLISAGHGFREAVKFYLPKLLLGPISHAFLYLDYVNNFLKMSPNEEDKDIFEQVQGLLKPVQCELETIVATLPKNYRETMVHTRRHTRRQSAIEKIKELQNIVEHWDNVGQSCNEFITEDTLQKLSSGKRITERKVYLFDGLLVLCKSNTRRQGVTTAVVGSTNFDFRLKERFFMRKVEVIDRPDTDDIKHSFEIAPRAQQPVILIAKNTQHKNDWMADLIMVNTKSMLDRILDSILLDIEKKHPLRLPSPEIYKFSEPDSPENILLDDNVDNTGVPLVKGGTIHKLVERLTYHIYSDPKFVRQFLTTFRTFSTPTALLQLLIERFNIPDPSLVYESTNDKDFENDKLHKNYQREDWKRYKKEYVQPVQFRVLNALRHWVDHHFYDFELEPQVLVDMLTFLESVNGKTMRKWVDSVLKIIQRKKEQAENHKQITFAFGHSPPPIEHYIQVADSEINLLTLHPLELARQVTLLQSELYRTVKACEVVDTVWTKKDKLKYSPNLIKMITVTNNFARWIEKSIVDTLNFEERVAVITRAAEVVLALNEFNNFNALLSTAACFQSAAVHRLKITLQSVSPRYIKTITELISLSDDHYRKYQDKLRSINPPCVPFFGMYLTHIVHTEEGNPNYLPNTTLINFAKRRKVADITSEIQQYQNQPYCLLVDNQLRNFLINLDPFPNLNEGEVTTYLYDASLRLEPRGCKQALKHPRQFPDITLKSPGLKPRRQNHTNSIKSLQPTSITEGEQSPPASMLNTSTVSMHDYSIFSNVTIQSQSSLSQSELNLNSLSSTLTNSDYNNDSSMMAPELPKRSNSMSLSNNTSTDMKPILSPRIKETTISTNFYNSHQPVVSPKYFETLNEEHNTIVDNLSNNHNCLINEGGTHYDNRYEKDYMPSSPKLQNTIYDNNTSNNSSAGQPPISPHVNVPNTLQSQQKVFVQPPPLPPRRERKESSAVLLAQTKQRPDAPQLPPRDISPPPIPPRLGLIQNPKVKNGDLFEHSLKLPHTSTIMLRRAQNAEIMSGTPIMQHYRYNNNNNNNNNMCNNNNSNNNSNNNINNNYNSNNDNCITSDNTHLNISNANDISLSSSSSSSISLSASATTVNIKKRPSISPRFSPGDTTPKLPPKPRNTNFITNITDKMTMFPYPSTNHE